MGFSCKIKLQRADNNNYKQIKEKVKRGGEKREDKTLFRRVVAGSSYQSTADFSVSRLHSWYQRLGPEDHLLKPQKGSSYHGKYAGMIYFFTQEKIKKKQQKKRQPHTRVLGRRKKQRKKYVSIKTFDTIIFPL